MKTIKETTKKGKALAKSYWKSTKEWLSECYTRPSTEKRLVQARCRSMMKKENGWRFRITNYNTFHFSCGWLTDDGIRIETKSNSYKITY